MRHPFKEFLFFTRWQRRGILTLAIAILLVLFLSRIREMSFFRERQLPEAAETARLREVYRHFLDSMRVADAPAGFSRRADAPRGQEGVLTPFPFNPNTADSSTLCRLGLPGWMARNVVRYREKGGRFRRVSDFARIYGLTEAQYETLRPWIELPEEEEREPAVRPGLLVVAEKSVADSVLTLPVKYPSGTLVDLNRADTTELMKIPGIGSGIARMIDNYRRQLGGFYSIEQLGEIRLDYRQLEEWFTVRPQDIQRINLNRAGIERLRRHPYISFYQAKAFVEYRKRQGDIHSLKPFCLLEEFTEEELERIAHYVCFE